MRTLYRHWLGVLDEETRSRWLDESRRKIAPWHTEPVELHPFAMQAAIDLIWIPPDNEQQAARDAAGAGKRVKTNGIRRVITGSPIR